ncbi:MAG TPA: PAS domain S-box protein, partial [Rubricoccaceae bacterium]
VHAFALFLIDPDGRVVTWNPGAERLFGWTAGEIVGRSSEALWVPEDLAVRADQAERETAATEGQALDERWHLRRDGTRVWVSGVATVIRDAGGRVIRFAKVGRDATDQRRVLEALADSEKALREREGDTRAALEDVSERNVDLDRQVAAERAEVRRLADALAESVLSEQRRIAAVLHDDLQQLLVGANMRVQALRESIDMGSPAQTREDADAVLRILTEAFQTTRTLTARLVPPDLLTAPIADAFRWLADDFAETHGLLVTLDAEAETGGVTVEGHVRVLLFQAARELLFNVVKHAGTLEATVAVRARTDALTIVVEDRGAGLPPAGGVDGYGLADVRARLGLVGGTLDVGAHPDGGVRVVMSIGGEGRP